MCGCSVGANGCSPAWKLWSLGYILPLSRVPPRLNTPEKWVFSCFFNPQNTFSVDVRGHLGLYYFGVPNFQRHFLCISPKLLPRFAKASGHHRQGSWRGTKRRKWRPFVAFQDDVKQGCGSKAKVTFGELPPCCWSCHLLSAFQHLFGKTISVD